MTTYSGGANYVMVPCDNLHANWAATIKRRKKEFHSKNVEFFLKNIILWLHLLRKKCDVLRRHSVVALFIAHKPHFILNQRTYRSCVHRSSTTSQLTHPNISRRNHPSLRYAEQATCQGVNGHRHAPSVGIEKTCRRRSPTCVGTRKLRGTSKWHQWRETIKTWGGH